MAYETGTSTGPSDLLDKLRLFLIAQGWSVNLWDDDNYNYQTPSGIDGTGKRLHVQKTATDGTVMYFNFRSAIRGIVSPDSNYSQQIGGKWYGELTGIAMNGSTGYNASNRWCEQPGYSQHYLSMAWAIGIAELSTTSIPSYHFFADGDTVVVAVEYSTGKYQFLCFGCLEKQGVFTGGQFFTGSFQSSQFAYQYTAGGGNYCPWLFVNNEQTYYPNGAIYLNVDSEASWRRSDYPDLKLIMPCIGGQRGNAEYTKGGIACFFLTKEPNSYNAMAAMSPLYLFGKRTSGNYSLLGWPKSIRTLNIVNYSAGQELAYGSETWKLFPASLEGTVLNPNVGFAVKKVV